MSPPADQGGVDVALNEVRRLRAAGAVSGAVDALERLLGRHPKEPRALNMLGAIRLAERDYVGAADCFDQACAVDPAPQILLNLAFARNGLGDAAGERDALDRALIADPYFQLALFHRGMWTVRHDGPAAGAPLLSNFLATIPPDGDVLPHLREPMAQAIAIVTEDSAALDRVLAQAFPDGLAAGSRMAEAMAIMLGKSRVFHSEPTGLYVPFLPSVPFFDRGLFPWFAELEAATSAIQEELRAVLAADIGLQPYVTFAAAQPVNQWAALNHSPAWSVFHLIRDGVPVADHCERCPNTAALLARLPLLDLPGRGPNAMFSILKPMTSIPPHVGATNARAVVHLPLVVPPGCGFRVGSAVREWQVGEAWAFDDTIEHAAWNQSGEPRAILILDAWNPHLSEAERAQVGIATRAIERHAGRAEWTA